MAPQILERLSYTTKCDIWSIGILTYELLTGDIPFKIGCEKELKKIVYLRFNIDIIESIVSWMDKY